MSWIWIKLASGLVFILIPGFSLQENFKCRPFLTLVSLLSGFMLLYLSLKPLVDAEGEIGSLKSQMSNLQRSFKEESVNGNERISNTNIAFPNNTQPKSNEINSRQYRVCRNSEGAIVAPNLFGGGDDPYCLPGSTVSLETRTF